MNRKASSSRSKPNNRGALSLLFTGSLSLVIAICGILLLHGCVLVKRTRRTLLRLDAPSRQSSLPTPSGARQRGIVLSSQCSGSTWLCSVLNGSSHVIWGGEEMVKYSKHTNTAWKNTSWETYKQDLEQSFKRLLSSSPFVLTSTASLVGFKLMYDQLPDHLYKPFANWLNANEIIVIHLVRRASVLRYASHVEKRNRIRQGGYARYTNETQLKRDNAIANAGKLELDEQALNVIRRHERHMEDFDLFIRSHAPMAPYVELAYEALTGSHQGRVFRSLNGFLGLPEEVLAQSSLVRSNPGTCSDRVANHKAKTLLEGTRSESECIAIEAANDNAFRESNMELLPPSKGDRCRFKFSHCHDDPDK